MNATARKIATQTLLPSHRMTDAAMAEDPTKKTPAAAAYDAGAPDCAGRAEQLTGRRQR